MSTAGPTQEKKIRIDPGFQLVYPSQPDKRGRARIVVKRKAYYFGQHGSAVSYAMFARWKKEFERDGSPTVGSAYKDGAAAYLSEPKQRWWRSRENIKHSLALAIACIVLSAGFTTWILSSPETAKVDGIVLTAPEMDFVRGRRTHEAEMAAFDANQGERVAALNDLMSKEGLPRERLPHIVARPPLGRLD
jgi:hypothetical protein